MSAGDKVFIDSGAFIAFLDRSDALHDEVRMQFASRPRSWCTSLPVIGETQGWLLHRMGEPAAEQFLELLGELPRLTILGADRSHHRAVLDKLHDLRGCKLTWVDASSLVWLEEREIETVWGTDHHLGLEGATVKPGSA